LSFLEVGPAGDSAQLVRKPSGSEVTRRQRCGWASLSGNALLSS